MGFFSQLAGVKRARSGLDLEGKWQCLAVNLKAIMLFFFCM